MMGMLILISALVIFTLITAYEDNARLKDIINRLENMKKDNVRLKSIIEKMKDSLENMKKGEQK